MSMPTDQISFFLHPVVFTVLMIGFSLVGLALCLFFFPKIRKYFKPLFKFYYAITMGPMYAVAGMIYALTFSKVNLFEKFKEINFQQKFKDVYLNTDEIFEDMRVNPQNYHLWAGIFVCAVFITLDYFFISMLTYAIYNGNQSIIFGILSNIPPITTNPWANWVYMAIMGNIVWVPTKFALHWFALLLYKNHDKSDEPTRPWWDKPRLFYISWGYIIAADAVWCFGMLIACIAYFIWPMWQVLAFMWVPLIICGLIELFYQQHTIHHFYKDIGWAKGFLIWLLSMLPFILTGGLLIYIMGPLIVGWIP